jgi:F0F1-type ATP synthase assembly protein I
MNKKFFEKFENSRELVRAMSVYTGASIFGPLILIGGGGYLLDRYFDTKPLLTIIGVFIAFVLSNVLLFKKSMALTRHISETYRKKEKSEDEAEKKESEKNSSQ